MWGLFELCNMKVAITDKFSFLNLRDSPYGYLKGRAMTIAVNKTHKPFPEAKKNTYESKQITTSLKNCWNYKENIVLFVCLFFDKINSLRRPELCFNFLTY